MLERIARRLTRFDVTKKKCSDDNIRPQAGHINPELYSKYKNAKVDLNSVILTGTEEEFEAATEKVVEVYNELEEMGLTYLGYYREKNIREIQTVELITDKAKARIEIHEDSIQKLKDKIEQLESLIVDDKKYLSDNAGRIEELKAELATVEKDPSILIHKKHTLKVAI